MPNSRVVGLCEVACVTDYACVSIQCHDFLDAMGSVGPGPKLVGRPGGSRY